MTTITTQTKTQVGQILFGTSTYSILQFLDEGMYGIVARCKDLHTKETVAVKIMKDRSDVEWDATHEVSILEEISALGPDRINVVKFIEHFEDEERKCLVFEMLDMNLYDLFHAQNNEPLCLHEIRAIAKQLLVALDALKSLGIVHSDIKPDNIMAVDMQGQPIRVKLIDFGVALHASNATIGQEIQPIGYRAPEISLGLPFNEAIDAWGLGCLLAFLYLAEHLFQVDSEYQMMRSIVTILGQPSERLLREGIYARYFFCEDKASSDSEHPTWRLLTPEEYSAVCQEPEKPSRRSSQLSSLDDLLHIHPIKSYAEYADRKAFVDLLKRLLHLESDKRISPDEALRCPFITMSHLAEHSFYRSYLTEAQTVMDLVEHPADQVDPTEESFLFNTKEEDSDYGSLQETSDTFSSEEAPGSLDESGYSDEEDSDPARPPSGILSPWSFDEDDLSLMSDEELQLPSDKDASDKDCVRFMDDLILESVDDFIDFLGEDTASRPADRPFTTGTSVLQVDDAGSLSSVPSGILLPSSSEGAQEKDASHHEPSKKQSPIRWFRKNRVACLPDGSADSPSASPSSSGHCRKILKRMHRFFRRIGETFCFCCHVED